MCHYSMRTLQLQILLLLVFWFLYSWESLLFEGLLQHDMPQLLVSLFPFIPNILAESIEAGQLLFFPGCLELSFLIILAVLQYTWLAKLISVWHLEYKTFILFILPLNLKWIFLRSCNLSTFFSRMLSVEPKIELLLVGSDLLWFFCPSYQTRNISPIVTHSICSPACVSCNKIIPTRKRHYHSFIDASESCSHSQYWPWGFGTLHFSLQVRRKSDIA